MGQGESLKTVCSVGTPVMNWALAPHLEVFIPIIAIIRQRLNKPIATLKVALLVHKTPIVYLDLIENKPYSLNTVLFLVLRLLCLPEP